MLKLVALCILPLLSPEARQLSSVQQATVSLLLQRLFEEELELVDGLVCWPAPCGTAATTPARRVRARVNCILILLEVKIDEVLVDCSVM